MNKFEEIFFISSLLANAQDDNSIDLNSEVIYSNLFLSDQTTCSEDYLYELSLKQVLYYEEIGEEGFKPIIMCSVTSQTQEYLKQLINNTKIDFLNRENEIEQLKSRINEILTFNPEKLSREIMDIENTIKDTRKQLDTNSLLAPLTAQLDQIEIHFKSLSKVAHNYEEVYKNILLPVREEGKSGIKQTVKWAIISIIASSIISIVINYFTKS